jgi:hypothetical protein
MQTALRLFFQDESAVKDYPAASSSLILILSLHLTVSICLLMPIPCAFLQDCSHSSTCNISYEAEHPDKAPIVQREPTELLLGFGGGLLIVLRLDVMARWYEG